MSWNRCLVVALVALLGAACSSFDSGSGGTGGRGGGAGGSATGGSGGETGTGGAGGAETGGSGGAVGDGGAGGVNPDGGNDAPVGTDSGVDAPTDGSCVGGDCCPDDPDKTQPGVCGCGVPDIDTDGDGTPDCNDMCITDRNKVQPGLCGCNGVDTDTDTDGTPDCLDRCKLDKTRTVPGLCGCGPPDSTAPLCLAHRYSFDDAASATMVRDSVGTANGTAMNVTLPGNGTLTLAGGTSDQYVKLPARIISGLGDNATFEAWITWAGGGPWQRVFDFGNNDNGATGGQGTGNSFVFFTPLGGPAGTTFLSVNTVNLTEVSGPAAFPTGLTAAGKPHHVACVVDAKNVDGMGPSALFYIDGVFVQRTPLVSVLSELDDLNNWLGRSQFAPDAELGGTYYEFRIYAAALTPAQITASFNAGPEALP